MRHSRWDSKKETSNGDIKQGALKGHENKTIKGDTNMRH